MSLQFGCKITLKNYNNQTKCLFFSILVVVAILFPRLFFRKHYDLILIVTNQQGIGKGLMTEADLTAVHAKLQEALGDTVDRIYHCPELERAHSFRRKPNIGMALQAHRDYPELRLKESVMVGDSMTDMLFGRRAGMQTVLVGDNSDVWQQQPYLVDRRYPTLLDYAQSL